MSVSAQATAMSITSELLEQWTDTVPELHPAVHQTRHHEPVVDHHDQLPAEYLSLAWNAAKIWQLLDQGDSGSP